MKTRLTLKPGQNGTKKLLDCYGDRLVCVRYRYDVQERKRYKTVELIVDAADWEPPLDSIVHIRVGLDEADLRRQIKRARARWDMGKKLWELSYGQVKALNLQDRIVMGINEKPEDAPAMQSPTDKSPRR